TKITKFASVPLGMTLSEVNNAAGELPGVESSVDVAYDESGARVWYSYNDFTGAKGFTEVTIPGVGVYHAEKTGGVDGRFALRRMDLVAGGFRDDGGVARFPMTDAQGNVRGYATTQGIQGAYDYYPYGTVVDLQVDGGADDKRWQDKEFDGEHGKYYFGARYFDPFFALWMSPDPAGVFFRVTLARLKSRSFIEKDILRLSDGEAVLPKRSFGVSGQFANPYTYGGDPVNFADPNGESIVAAMVVGAIVGATMAGGIELAGCDDIQSGECWEGVGKSALIGGIAGAAGGASSWAAGGFALDAAASASGGLAANMTLGEAVGLGALSVGAGSGASYTASYALSTPFDDWDLDNFFTGFNTSVISGAVVGAAMGAASWGISYSANLENQARRESLYKRDAEGNILYDENGKTQYRDDISESRKFVDKEYKKQNNGLYKGPTDTKFQASVIKEDQYPELYEELTRKLPDVGDYRYTDGSNLHVNAKKVDVILPDGTKNKILQYEGHFDYYNPKYWSQVPLHGYEFLRGKNFDPYAAASALRSSPDSEGFLFW
ncbi:MAG: hypothetical protein MJZ22_04220, partial [Candidatus Saccharibacteria bacterium]|nr:hypothetical protein [Candidatus Saccharibacteria bacterium]